MGKTLHVILCLWLFTSCALDLIGRIRSNKTWIKGEILEWQTWATSSKSSWRFCRARARCRDFPTPVCLLRNASPWFSIQSRTYSHNAHKRKTMKLICETAAELSSLSLGENVSCQIMGVKSRYHDRWYCRVEKNMRKGVVHSVALPLCRSASPAPE